jgi:hypothetical protein
MLNRVFTFFILPSLMVATGVAVAIDVNESLVPDVEEIVQVEEVFVREDFSAYGFYYDFSDEVDIITEVVEVEDPIPDIPDIPDGLRCPDYYLSAKEIGWPEDQLDRLDYVIWRESRCDSSAHNEFDPASGSRGIIQINGFWCRPNRYSSEGFLQENGVIDSCEDLFDPEINLKAGLVIYNYGVEKHGCGWGPWSTRKSSWCKKH